MKKIKIYCTLFFVGLVSLNYKFFETGIGPLRWIGKMPVIQYRVNPNIQGLQNIFDPKDVVKAVIEGADPWMANGGPVISPEYSGTTDRVEPFTPALFECSKASRDSFRSNTNLIYSIDIEDPDCTSESCTFLWSCENEILHFDMQLNTDKFRFDDLSLLKSVVGHNIGHIAGLTHCETGALQSVCNRDGSDPSSESVMSRFNPDQTSVWILSQDDADGVKALYLGLGSRVNNQFVSLRERAVAPSYGATAAANQAIPYAAPSVGFLFQLNSELLTELGDFYTQDHLPLPKLNAVSDVAIMLPSAELRPGWMRSVDAHHFILDGTTGTLFYTIGKNIHYIKNNEFIGAQKISVEPYGRIAILNDGYINLCWSFDGWAVKLDAGCVANRIGDGTVIAISASGKNLFIAGTRNGKLQRVSSTGHITAVPVPFQINGLKSIWADSTTLVITDKNGERVTVVDSATSTIIAQNQDFVLNFGLGEIRAPVKLNYVSPLSGGGYVGVSEMHSSVIFFDQGLNYAGAHTMIILPYPVRLLKGINGLAVNLEGGTYAVWSNLGINVYAVRETVDYDFSWLVADIPVVPDFSIDDLKFEMDSALSSNPQFNVLDLPQIKSLIDAGRAVRP